MAKVRVFEAAKQHELDVEELLDTLRDMGVKVRSHMSPVDEGEIESAVKTIGKKKPKKSSSDEGEAPKLMVRRRKKKEVEEDDDEGAAEIVEEVVGEAETEEPPVKEASEEPETPESPSEMAAEAEVAIEEQADDAPEQPAAEIIEKAPAKEAAAEETEVVEAAVAEVVEEAPAEKKAPKEKAKKAPAEPAKKGAGKPADESADAEGDEEKEFGLKVVRFIQPEERGQSFEKPTSGPGYPVSKKEREARKAERKAKKRKGRREEKGENKRAAKKTQITTPKAIKRRIKISDIITVADLAKRMGVKSTEVIKTLMGLGILSTINQPLDADTATLVADEFGYEIENTVLAEEELLQRAEDKPEDLKDRPPVITVMGHVDHGKTSLLDAIRETRVADGESGGITQHIGAYRVETSRGNLVFLDTPGHAAFTEMRARGAKLTDIVILVVAANDGVMPQTVEAINHAEAAGVPIIVAINKMDLPDATPDKVMRELAEKNLIPEEWGGQTICIPISAKKGNGIEELLEMVALQAELLELKANPNKLAAGIVVEARLDRGRGPVSTVLVQEGTLKLGDIVLSGDFYGRVRALTNDKGKREKEITPGMPVEITGLSGVPSAGDNFVVVETERMAKEISSRRVEKSREAERAQARKVSLDDFHNQMMEGDVQTLNLIVKGDVQGSVEAVAQSLEKLSTDEVQVNVIHKGAGGITESDVHLAIASQAIIVGFHVRAEAKARGLAEQSGIDVRLYDVIYDATEDVKRAMEGMLAPMLQEKPLGRVEVRQIFRVPKIGVIAGCYVTDGIVKRNSKLRLIRDNVVIYECELSSLKRFKDDAKEVREGLECGLSIHNYQDLKEGDEIEFYEIEEIAQKL
ncbi:MAG: translation initiation factor IF-2 [Deltaproteobacteria bacterium]|nr:MAG: translation initiation factor IF-2 [Deltaproteobacteria bacterium]